MSMVLMAHISSHLTSYSKCYDGKWLGLLKLQDLTHMTYILLLNTTDLSISDMLLLLKWCLYNTAFGHYIPNILHHTVLSLYLPQYPSGQNMKLKAVKNHQLIKDNTCHYQAMVHSLSTICIQDCWSFEMRHVAEPLISVISPIVAETLLLLCQMIRSSSGCIFWIASVHHKNCKWLQVII